MHRLHTNKSKSQEDIKREAIQQLDWDKEVKELKNGRRKNKNSN